MNFGIDVNMSGLILCGFGISFGLWAVSRAVRFIFELSGSKYGQIRPE